MPLLPEFPNPTLVPVREQGAPTSLTVARYVGHVAIASTVLALLSVGTIATLVDAVSTGSAPMAPRMLLGLLVLYAPGVWGALIVKRRSGDGGGLMFLSGAGELLCLWTMGGDDAPWIATSTPGFLFLVAGVAGIHAARQTYYR